MKFHFLTAVAAVLVAFLSAPVAYASTTAATHLTSHTAKAPASDAEDSDKEPKNEDEAENQSGEDNLPPVEGAPSDGTSDKDTIGDEE